MALDPHVQQFLKRLSLSAPRSAGALTVEERRVALTRLLSLGGEPPEVARTEAYDIAGPAGNLSIRAYDPLEAAGARGSALVYFHGGGLVAGTLDAYDGIARCLANASGCRLIAVDYRLGPEARFPAALRDACAATEWVIDHAVELDVDPDRLGVCGDSAGATLAVAVCQQRAADRLRGVALQVLLCPILDYRAATIARRSYDRGDLLDRLTLEHDVAHYLQADSNRADPRVSPLLAEGFADLPPAYIHTAACDPVREDGSEYARKLRDAGVPVSYRCHTGMIHLFYGLGMVIPYVAEAYRTIGAEIRAELGEEVL